MPFFILESLLADRLDTLANGGSLGVLNRADDLHFEICRWSFFHTETTLCVMMESGELSSCVVRVAGGYLLFMGLNNPGNFSLRWETENVFDSLRRSPLQRLS